MERELEGRPREVSNRLTMTGQGSENPSVKPSQAEIRVLVAIAKHGTAKAAATNLCISSHTAENHLRRLRSKSGHRHVHQIVRWAARNGWLKECD